MINEQISFSLQDEVAPYFDNVHIASLCRIIDQKQSKGLRYGDLKEILLKSLEKSVDLNNPEDTLNPHRRAYEFAKYF